MRLPRLDFPGARHHVMNRGARRAPIFDGDDARGLFLEVVSELPARFGVRVHAYALMPNHYHLMIESVTGRLPRAMRHLGGEFTRRLNRRRRWDGPVFRGRYRNRLVDTDAYWRHLLVYLHLNPVRAGLSSATEAQWTSHRAFLGQTERPEWLTTSELEELYGSREAYLAAYNGWLEGSEPAPESFDPEALWSPNTTGTVDVPDLAAPTTTPAEAMADVCRVTGLTAEEILRVPRGRRGNPANWLVAWWMSRGCGIDHGQIAWVLGTGHSALSQRIRRVEERRESDERLRDWISRLNSKT